MKNAITPSATTNATHRRDRRLTEREDTRLVPALEQLVEAAAEDRGNREEERVAGGRGTLVAHERARR